MDAKQKESAIQLECSRVRVCVCVRPNMNLTLNLPPSPSLLELPCRAIKIQQQKQLQKKPVLIGRLIKLIVSLFYKTIAELITYMCMYVHIVYICHIYLCDFTPSSM